MPTTTRHRAGMLIGPNGQTGRVLLSQVGSFDPTVTQGTAVGITLPQGAVVIDVLTDGGATGGASPTIDIGWTGDTDALANELDADAAGSAAGAGTIGASAFTALTESKTILGINGASAATGGTSGVTIVYYLDETVAREPSAE